MNTRLSAAISITLLCFSGTASAAFLETFDSNNAGWDTYTIQDNNTQAASAAAWSGSGGNPNGHISMAVDNDATRAYAFAPTLPTSSVDLTGLTLTTDFKMTGSVTAGNNLLDPVVRFYIGCYACGGQNYYVSNDIMSWDPNSDISWTTHQVALLAANFTAWTGIHAGTRTFEQVVAGAAQDYGLVFTDGISGHITNSQTLGFASTSGATIAIDNFGAQVVPVPAAVWLFGSALGLLGWMRRKASL